jgi:PAS domain S-box-containing protein
MLVSHFSLACKVCRVTVGTSRGPGWATTHHPFNNLESGEGKAPWGLWMASTRKSKATTSAEDLAALRAIAAGVTPSPGPAAGSLQGATGAAGVDGAASRPPNKHTIDQLPELQLLYETAPIGLAFLSPDCRYLQINRRLTEICGISVADHIGRSVRDTVPQVAAQVEHIVQTILRTGEPITGIEVNGQRPDGGNAERVWITYWHPLKDSAGSILGINVVAEEITERKRAEAALAASETRFRELADNMSQIAWTADPTGGRTWFNKRWYDYTGTALEDVQGSRWQKLHHPDYAERAITQMRESYEIGAAWEDTFPLRGRDGTFRWFLTQAVPIRNEAGDVVRWWGTNTDVTRQVEAEQALRKLNETLEQRVEAQARERDRIWDVAEDLLIVADTNGKILSINPAWTATLGWSEGDLLGTTFGWLLHPDDREKTSWGIAHLAEGRKALRFENRLRHKGGSYRWLSWGAVPDKGHIYAVARDVTDLKNAEDQLRVLRQELAQVSRRTTMGAMTASIAHEINQPLAAIVTNANAGLRWLARADPDLDEVRSLLKRIVNDGHRASAVIASIRSMFGTDSSERSPVSMNDVVADVLALVRGELESHQVSLQNEMPDALPLVMAKRIQLQQVLLNLIMNAVDAMSSVTDRERVLTVQSRVCESDHVLITLEDSGGGIDPNHMDRIFDAFFTTKAHGMGMGLSICRSIIEAHDGRLWASGRSPCGSIFYIKLPGTASGNGLSG